MPRNTNASPVVIGGLVAAIAIGAFAVGWTMSSEPEGPAEELGESLDEASEELKQGLEQGAREIEEGAETVAD